MVKQTSLLRGAIISASPELQPYTLLLCLAILLLLTIVNCGRRRGGRAVHAANLCVRRLH